MHWVNGPGNTVGGDAQFGQHAQHAVDIRVYQDGGQDFGRAGQLGEERASIAAISSCQGYADGSSSSSAVREDHGWFQIFVNTARLSEVPEITVTHILISYNNLPKLNIRWRCDVTVVSDQRRLERVVTKGTNVLGIIADDFTGATDIATMLRRSGHRVAVVIEDGALTSEQLASLDAIVIALKSRSGPKDAAVAASLEALSRLQAWDVSRFYVKYCSTFDSTDEGNIGPVLDAVTEALGVQTCVVVPSLPANHRTVYNGHLFVGGELLENSPMRHHPLTPMTRSRVADLLRPQTSHTVGEVTLDKVRPGPATLRSAIDDAETRYVVVDAIDDGDLAIIGAATADDLLVSGGSGLAIGIPGPGGTDASWAPPPPGRGAVLCGSVSSATLSQIAHAATTQPVRQVDIHAAIAGPDEEAAGLAAWVLAQPADSTPVVCAARDRNDVLPRIGGVETAPIVERVLTQTASLLLADPTVSALIVAGGETSGAVLRGLAVQSLQIGPELAPGVCWSAADTGGRTVALALKSGNFGGTDLFTSAWERLA